MSSSFLQAQPLSVCTFDGIAPLADRPRGASHHLRFQASPGLHQLSIIADAGRFNWDELYCDLHEFNNKGQRTGPWDFSLLKINGKSSCPLVPAYWVKLDGQDLGLWYFQRVSLEDLAGKRFRGHMAFDVKSAGEHELQMTPYRDFDIQWLSARFEADPDDRLIPWMPAGGVAPHPLAAWRDPAFWQEQRRKLATTHQAYAGKLAQAMDASVAVAKNAPDHLPLLVAAHHLGGHQAAMPRAIEIIDRLLALPAWGNPSPDGYGHNGDMMAAQCLRLMAWAHHMIDDDAMTADRRARLHAKLTHQMDRFMEQALLNRDYWGGSLLQDHGWRSMGDFAAAALSLLGVLPGAERWVSYALPRLRRALAAMPRDGAIPPSSYNTLILYVREIGFARQMLWELSGRREDLYDDGAFEPVVGYMADLLRRDEPVMLLNPDQQGGRIVQNFGLMFFNTMASRLRDGLAARLSQHILQGVGRPAAAKDKQEHVDASSQDALWGFLTHDPTIAPATWDRPAVLLKHYEDSGFVHYHDARQDVTLALRCAPWSGWHADRLAPGPCDRMGVMPAAGHFVLYRGQTQLLANADSTYRMNTRVRNAMLVDDQGQVGDIGYPMSIPSFRHPGHEVQWARWDAASQQGAVRLSLTPAYPAALGVLSYTREIIFKPSDHRQIICRDHVVLDRPRKLSWLFHVNRQLGVTLLSPSRSRLGDGELALFLEPVAQGVELVAAVHPTEVVYGYSSAFNTFDHVRYDSQSPVASAVVDFVFNW